MLVAALTPRIKGSQHPRQKLLLRTHLLVETSSRRGTSRKMKRHTMCLSESYVQVWSKEAQLYSVPQTQLATEVENTM